MYRVSNPPKHPSSIVNAMSVDVEDWFQVSAFERTIARDSWDSQPCRVERNVDRILAMFDAHKVHATFFTLGWIGQRYPRLVRSIVDAGHELASHGYGHERVTQLTPQAFRDDLLRSKELLEDIGGVPVRGYRAPSFSIGAANLWAHDVLRETGHLYSSSVYPVRHDLYGMPEAPRFAHVLANGLTEIPPTTVQAMGRNYPASGGGFFRLLPYSVSKQMIRRVNLHDAQPAMFYFHPWEIDPEQPRVAEASAKSRFRHYLNLTRTAARLERLLSDFRWNRVDHVFAAALQGRA